MSDQARSSSTQRTSNHSAREPSCAWHLRRQASASRAVWVGSPNWPAARPGSYSEALQHAAAAREGLVVEASGGECGGVLVGSDVAGEEEGIQSGGDAPGWPN